MNIDHLSVRTVQMTVVKRKETHDWLQEKNVLLNTMKLDKTVNQQRRPFIPKERGEKLIVPTREMQEWKEIPVGKIDLNWISSSFVQASPFKLRQVEIQKKRFFLSW